MGNDCGNFQISILAGGRLEAMLVIFAVLMGITVLG
jgi:hypothetical protein